MSAAALNLRHIRALAAAVRAGSLSGAAAAIGLTQPAVTQAIARLEATTGTRLLERGPGGVTPTDGGILLAARAEAAMAELGAAFRPFRKGGSGARAGGEQDMTMAQLQALLALAQGGSYVAGAAAAGVTEPSLHRAVSDLERSCGVALVERQGRGVALTEAGVRLARACRLAAAELDAALDELAVLSGRDQGVVRIAASAAAMVRLVPRAVARFLANHAPVRVELVQLPPADAARRLADGLLEAVVMLSDAAPDGLAAERLIDVQFHIAGRPGHPLAAAGSPGLVRLAGFGWALPPEPAEERMVWQRLFLDGGVYPPPVNVTCDAPAALPQLIGGTDLLTIRSSETLAADPRADLATIGDPLPGSRRPLTLLTRAGWYPTPAQATLLDELRATAAALASF